MEKKQNREKHNADKSVCSICIFVFLCMFAKRRHKMPEFSNSVFSTCRSLFPTHFILFDVVLLLCVCVYFFCHSSVFYVNNNNFEGNETDLIVYFFFPFHGLSCSSCVFHGIYTVQYPFEALAFYLSAVSSIFVFRHSLQTAFFLLSLSLSE